MSFFYIDNRFRKSSNISIYNVHLSFIDRYYLYMSNHALKYITASLLLTVIGKPLPKTCSVYSIISSAHSYPLQNYISREEFTLTGYYLNQLINSLINYFYFFQNSQNTIANVRLGFMPTIHSLVSYRYTSLYRRHLLLIRTLPKNCFTSNAPKNVSFSFYNRLFY